MTFPGCQKYYLGGIATHCLDKKNRQGQQGNFSFFFWDIQKAAQKGKKEQTFTDMYCRPSTTKPWPHDAGVNGGPITLPRGYGYGDDVPPPSSSATSSGVSPSMPGSGNSVSVSVMPSGSGAVCELGGFAITRGNGTAPQIFCRQGAAPVPMPMPMPTPSLPTPPPSSPALAGNPLIPNLSDGSRALAHLLNDPRALPWIQEMIGARLHADDLPRVLSDPRVQNMILERLPSFMNERPSDSSVPAAASTVPAASAMWWRGSEGGAGGGRRPDFLAPPACLYRR